MTYCFNSHHKPFHSNNHSISRLFIFFKDRKSLLYLKSHHTICKLFTKAHRGTLPLKRASSPQWWCQRWQLLSGVATQETATCSEHTKRIVLILQHCMDNEMVIPLRIVLIKCTWPCSYEILKCHTLRIWHCYIQIFSMCIETEDFVIIVQQWQQWFHAKHSSSIYYL